MNAIEEIYKVLPKEGMKPSLIRIYILRWAA